MKYTYKTHPIHNIKDMLAYRLVKSLAYIMDIMFKERYAHRAVVLETVAGVPGMVGGMLRHLYSLRMIKNDIYIKKLLEEAENERMHLMIYSHICRPTRFERFFIFITQSFFFLFYSAIYLISRHTAHRMVGYLEEEAVHSYTMFLNCIDDNKIYNHKAPEIAINYWGLADDATLRDVVIATRDDEIGHRDLNHNLANR